LFAQDSFGCLQGLDYSLHDKNIRTSTRFYAYITEKSHIPKMLCIFLTGGGGAYTPYATCKATPLRQSHRRFAAEERLVCITLYHTWIGNFYSWHRQGGCQVKLYV